MSRFNSFRLALATIVAVVAAICAFPSASLADRSQISSFQDDAKLIDSNAQTVISTLEAIRDLGGQ
jgi:hypothetical protein